MTAGNASCEANERTERIKEQLAYLRLWLGILAVTTLSLAGWAITHIHIQPLLLPLGGGVLAAGFGVGCREIHKLILHKHSKLPGG